MFPSSVSSLNGTNGFNITGVAAMDMSGGSASTAGDINGDGFDDMIIGASNANGTAQGSSGSPGASYVLFGHNVSWPAMIPLSSLNGTNGFTIPGITLPGDSELGFSVSTAGDINGDSIDDVIIGAPYYNYGSEGICYVVFGHKDLWPSSFFLSSLNGTNGFNITGIYSNIGDSLGRSVSNAGDINGDNIDDVILGDTGWGASYVIFGHKGIWPSSFSVNSLNGTNGFNITGSKTASTGSSVSTAGDINGDGIDDVIIGAGGFNNLTGASYVVFGQNQTNWLSTIALDSLNGTNGFNVTGVLSGDEAGYSVNTAGDINSDGIDDFIINAIQYYNDGPGTSYVLFGHKGNWLSTISLSSLNGTNGFTLVADDNGNGIKGNTAGDINGDGFDDLVIAANGNCYVMFGENRTAWPKTILLSNLNGTNGFELKGGSSTFNPPVGTAGDINGDGFDDLMIGSPLAGNDDQGATYIVFGNNSTAPIPPLHRPFCTSLVLCIAGGGISILGIIALGLLAYAAYRFIKKCRLKYKDLIEVTVIQKELEGCTSVLVQLEALVNQLKSTQSQQISQWNYDLLLQYKQTAEGFLNQKTVKRKEFKALIKDVIAFIEHLETEVLNTSQHASRISSNWGQAIEAQNKLRTLKASLQDFLNQPLLRASSQKCLFNNSEEYAINFDTEEQIPLSIPDAP